jgi:DNA-binding MarR family transcriptional regulator
MKRGSLTPSLEKETVLSLLKAADRVRRHFQNVVDPWGLTVQQFNVLRILRGAGPAGLPTLEVGERMIEKTPGVTRLIDRLADKGWVLRERSGEDRRQVFCRITEQGLVRLAELDEPIEEADRACLEELTPAEQGRLAALASRVGLCVNANCAGPPS